MDAAIAAINDTIHTSTELIDHLFKKYREGFYVHHPKESRITNKRRIARHVARYIRHPAVANTRLHRYDEKTVTFWYEDREGERHFVTMEVQEFIKALITKVNKRVPKYPNCGRKMTFVCYEKGPPIENEVFGCKLSDWNHPCLSHS